MVAAALAAVPAQAMAAQQAGAVQGDRDDRGLRRREPDDRGPDRAGVRAAAARRPESEPPAPLRGRAAIRPLAAKARDRPRPHDQRAPVGAVLEPARAELQRHRALPLGPRLAHRDVGPRPHQQGERRRRRGKAFCSLRSAGGRWTRAAGDRADSERLRLEARPAQRELLRPRRLLRRGARRLARRRRAVRARALDDDRGRGRAPARVRRARRRGEPDTGRHR